MLDALGRRRYQAGTMPLGGVLLQTDLTAAVMISFNQSQFCWGFQVFLCGHRAGGNMNLT